MALTDEEKILQRQNVKLDVEGLTPDEQKKVERGLKETSDQAGEIGRKLVELQASAVESASKISQSLASLAFLSEKLNTPISQIKAFAFGFEQIGDKTGKALSNLERFGEKLRTSPRILEKFESELGPAGFKNIGTVADKLESALKALAKLQRSGPQGQMVARAFAEEFGLDKDLITKLANSEDEYNKFYAESIARTKGIDEMGPAAIALSRSLNKLWAALNDTATKLAGRHFTSVSEIIDSWTKWIEENSESLVNDFDAIIKQFLKAGEDMSAVLLPFLHAAHRGFTLISDKVATTIGSDNQSGMRGIRYLLDTVTTLFFGSMLIRMLQFLNGLALGAPSILIGKFLTGLGLAFGGTFAGLAGIYETAKPQPLGEGEDELYRQAHPGWIPGQPKDQNWRPPRTAADANAPAAAPSAPVAPGGLPAAGNVTGLYGDPRATHSHAGWDISGAMGSPVVSTTGGKVIRAQRQTGYGNTVDVESPDGKYVFRYAHLQGMNVKVGDTVAPGGQVATMGNTGTSHEGSPGGVHVHTEVHLKSLYGEHPFGRGSTIDPAEYYGTHARGSHVPLGGGEAVRNPLSKVDPEGFHRAIQSLQHESMNRIPSPAIVHNLGTHNYTNNVTVVAQNPHEAALAIKARMEEIHKDSEIRFRDIGGKLSDFSPDTGRSAPLLFGLSKNVEDRRTPYGAIGRSEDERLEEIIKGTSPTAPTYHQMNQFSPDMLASEKALKEGLYKHIMDRPSRPDPHWFKPNTRPPIETMNYHRDSGQPIAKPVNAQETSQD